MRGHLIASAPDGVDNSILTYEGAEDSHIRGLGGRLLMCGSVEALRNNSPMPDTAQRLFDEVVINVGVERLQFVADLISEGLTFSLPNWLSVPQLYWEKISKSGGAQRTMTPKTRGVRDKQDRSGTYLPIFCTLDDFSYGIREILAAERAGASLDTSQVAQSTRRVNEAIEDCGINGWKDEGDTTLVAVAGNTVPGMLNAPYANTQAFESNMAWDNASKTGGKILIDVLAMINKLRAVNRYGPYNLYVNPKYDVALERPYVEGTTTFDITIRQRLERITLGGRPLRIRGVDRMPDDYVAMVNMTSDVVDIVVGQEPTLISWSDGPGWEMYFAVLACSVPRFKSDYNQRSGVCIGHTT